MYTWKNIVIIISSKTSVGLFTRHPPARCVAQLSTPGKTSFPTPTGAALRDETSVAIYTITSKSSKSLRQQ